MTVPAFIPTGDPQARRRFQLTSLSGNTNKFYMVETWPAPDGAVFFRAAYGRVGAAPQIDERVTTAQWVAQKIREKVGKGYQEIELHGPSTALAAAPAQSTPTLAPPVRQVIDYIYAEAGSNIASYLAVDVNALSQAQVAHGRTLLSAAHGYYLTWQTAQTHDRWMRLADTVEHYYNAIPTQLPHRIKHEQVVHTFCTQFDEQEDRLNQLEAALATYTVQQQQPQQSHYDLLGADLALVPPDDERHKAICTYIAQTSVHGYTVRVRDVFSVVVPPERRAWESNTRGKQRVDLLFHGTGSHNVRHILRGGLICPRTPSHGRMFGHGIYFANQATKSTNYCGASGPKRPHMLLLADVAIGRPYVARDAMPNCSQAPFLHDSVWGKAGKTQAWGGALRYDEHIVYNAAQQTLRFLVTFER